jgi:hypothetical protein
MTTSGLLMVALEALKKVADRLGVKMSPGM